MTFCQSLLQYEMEYLFEIVKMPIESSSYLIRARKAMVTSLLKGSNKNLFRKLNSLYSQKQISETNQTLTIEKNI